MGLEPTTPCLQIRPTWTMADDGERLCLIRAVSRMVANDGERQRMFDRCSIVRHRSLGWDRTAAQCRPNRHQMLIARSRAWGDGARSGASGPRPRCVTERLSGPGTHLQASG